MHIDVMRRIWHRRIWLAAPAVAPLLAMAIVALNFALSPYDPSAPYFRTAKIPSSLIPVADTSGIAVLTGPGKTLKAPTGSVARPDPRLTPGAVALSDPTAVCRQSRHAPRISNTNPLLSVAEQGAIYKSYRVAPNTIKRYSLDFLVPLQLGGAVTPANVWPISLTKGMGFAEKQRLNVRMHILVCHGEMPLADAQKLMADDWVALWVRYGA
jgi:hypothetical protein